LDAVRVREGRQLPGLYQDLVLDGRTVIVGRRDCRPRWETLLPHLPRAGAMLDVGSNLGWFALKMAEAFPRCVVASVEADDVSAQWQRAVLASHTTRRICLLTHRADRRLAERFVRAGQQFDAVLCLSVLHWLPDHRQLLAALGKITRRIFVEQPDPWESGAGTERLRQEIGPIGPYLESLFPERPRRRIGHWASHRESPHARELWLVDEPPDAALPPSPGLAVGAVAALDPCWPPRSWWQSEVDRLGREHRSDQAIGGSILFGPDGLAVGPSVATRVSLCRARRQIRAIPEHGTFAARTRWRRQIRRLTGRALRAVRLIE
jgi:SAM-dependent methyltransferase